MVKEKFQFIKNIILVVASALTLVAVTFAWFSTSHSNGVPLTINNVGNDVIDVTFYEKVGTKFEKLTGDIALDSAVSGQFNQYKMVISTNTSDPVKLSVVITDLPQNMNDALKNAVCIKYSLYKAVKNTNGTVEQGAFISGSNDSYVPLSTLADGVIFSGYSLKDYQQSKDDYFILNYEIGLSGDAGSSVQGLTSSLGNLSISAQSAK